LCIHTDDLIAISDRGIHASIAIALRESEFTGHDQLSQLHSASDVDDGNRRFGSAWAAPRPRSSISRPWNPPLRRWSRTGGLSANHEQQTARRIQCHGTWSRTGWNIRHDLKRPAVEHTHHICLAIGRVPIYALCIQKNRVRLPKTLHCPRHRAGVHVDNLNHRSMRNEQFPGVRIHGEVIPVTHSADYPCFGDEERAGGRGCWRRRNRSLLAR